MYQTVNEKSKATIYTSSNSKNELSKHSSKTSHTNKRTTKKDISPNYVYDTFREIETKTTQAFIKNHCLIIEIQNFLFDVVRKVDIETKETSSSFVSKRQAAIIVEKTIHNLEKISVEELSEIRNKNLPIFVLKEKGKIYYSIIPDNANIFSFSLFEKTDHKCNFSSDCRLLLSSSNDKNESCAKVQSYSTYIENCPWITDGYQTTNTQQDTFVVINCEFYKSSY